MSFSLDNPQLTSEQRLSNAIDYLNSLTPKAILDEPLAYEALTHFSKSVAFMGLREEIMSTLTKQGKIFVKLVPKISSN